MISPETFLTYSLKEASVGAAICRILASTINAVDPYQSVIKNLSRSENIISIGDQSFNLSKLKHVYIIGAGKAGLPMALATSSILGKYFSRGIVIVKEGYATLSDGYNLPENMEVIEAGHPIPDLRGMSGTQKIFDLLSETEEDDLIICLISGGGSALLSAPVPGITISDLQQITSGLLHSGATIHEVNGVRKHLELIKGGNLARLAMPSTIISLILSDVVGDSLEIIASGPTAPDSSTYQQALDILARYNLVKSSPPRVLEHLTDGVNGKIPETPKFQEAFFYNVHNHIIGSNRVALEAASEHAYIEGFNTLLLTNYLQGEAREVGKVIASIARQAATSNKPIPRPACILLGGETTVTVKANGQGGRNQELALSSVTGIAGLDRTMIITLATDGNDGPTNAAGAISTGDTYSRALNLKLDPVKYLDLNDSYHFFSSLGDLIITGPTQTNVNDITLIITY